MNCVVCCRLMWRKLPGVFVKFSASRRIFSLTIGQSQKSTSIMERDFVRRNPPKRAAYFVRARKLSRPIPSIGDRLQRKKPNPLSWFRFFLWRTRPKRTGALFRDRQACQATTANRRPDIAQKTEPAFVVSVFPLAHPTEKNRRSLP